MLALDASVIATRATDLARMIEAFDRAVAFALVHPDKAHATVATIEALLQEPGPASRSHAVSSR